ncbi:MAG TPA: hypothetical protein PLE54_06040 [Burkholderiaceae bacterium]|nr:hypothetical protein [Burkholderiaceae bacterium]
MTGRTDRATRYRVSVSAEATQRELRMCGFALLHQYLAMHLVIAEHLQLEPVELLILIATTTGNVQRAVHPGGLPEVLRGSTPLPPELIVPMSRRAIARVTGIPKETVRRHVDSMVRRGILLSMPRGVRARPGLADRTAMTAILRVVELHAACTEQLIRLGAITTHPAAPARSRRA